MQAHSIRSQVQVDQQLTCLLLPDELAASACPHRAVAEVPPALRLAGTTGQSEEALPNS